MKNDFKPVVGHTFNLSADWGAVDCQVLAVEPNKTLSYKWDAMGLESVVTWTLTPYEPVKLAAGRRRRHQKRPRSQPAGATWSLPRSR
jgi:uncharacterized protein YndB with AHSA1/START domain